MAGRRHGSISFSLPVSACSAFFLRSGPVQESRPVSFPLTKTKFPIENPLMPLRATQDHSAKLTKPTTKKIITKGWQNNGGRFSRALFLLPGRCLSVIILATPAHLIRLQVSCLPSFLPSHHPGYHTASEAVLRSSASLLPSHLVLFVPCSSLSDPPAIIAGSLFKTREIKSTFTRATAPS